MKFGKGCRVLSRGGTGKRRLAGARARQPVDRGTGFVATRGGGADPSICSAKSKSSIPSTPAPSPPPAYSATTRRKTWSARSIWNSPIGSPVAQPKPLSPRSEPEPRTWPESSSSRARLKPARRSARPCRSRSLPITRTPFSPLSHRSWKRWIPLLRLRLRLRLPEQVQERLNEKENHPHTPSPPWSAGQHFPNALDGLSGPVGGQSEIALMPERAGRHRCNQHAISSGRNVRATCWRLPRR